MLIEIKLYETIIRTRLLGGKHKKISQTAVCATTKYKKQKQC